MRVASRLLIGWHGGFMDEPNSRDFQAACSRRIKTIGKGCPLFFSALFGPILDAITSSGPYQAHVCLARFLCRAGVQQRVSIDAAPCRRAPRRLPPCQLRRGEGAFGSTKQDGSSRPNVMEQARCGRRGERGAVSSRVCRRSPSTTLPGRRRWTDVCVMCHC